MATAINPLVSVNPEQLSRLSADLVAVGDRIEASGSDDWLVVARAAALLDGLRHGLVNVPAELVHGQARH